MVTISKNGKTKTVSEPVYNSIFKDSGWEIVGEKSSTSSVKKEVEPVKQEVVEADVEKNQEEEDEIPDEVWDEVQAEEDVEKPISEMSHNELVEKAESLGIQTKGMNNKQLRDAIKEKM
jgi:AmiR/NasT family two-component response regulator